VDARFSATIACPDCLQAGELTSERFECRTCRRAYPVIDGAPVFVDDMAEHVDRRHVTNVTNRYAKRVVELLSRHPDALVLDFGAGHPRKEDEFPQVLRHDFVQYENTHVVSTKRNLPYRDDVFDVVVSLSVFEHVDDPWHYAAELHRVTKPGGRIMIDVAFLQPLHGDPHHYYNMTEQGLAHTFRMFRNIESGVGPRYQSPGVAMNIVTRRFMELVEDEAARQFLRARVGDLDWRIFDVDIAVERMREMAAGVYLDAVK
jgi:SAM-dependent methyltransferase